MSVYVNKREVDAIAVAYDELLSYVETVGDEGSLDDEEMPDGKLRWTLNMLRGILDRYAAYEQVHADRVVLVEPVRFTYRPDTPPSGPAPREEGAADG